MSDGVSGEPDGGSAAARAVLAANARFYEAFEARDLEALLDVWERSDRVVCTHPGWRTLRGIDAVAESWKALLDGPQRLQFILTDTQVEVIGDAAFVTGDENLLQGAAGGTVAALNVFVRDGEQGRWLMVAHHGSSVMSR